MSGTDAPDFDGEDLPSPRENARLQGHTAAERTLLDAYNSGRLAHAWLFTGPRGIGKATLAYRFARFMLAHGKEAGEKDGGGLFGDALAPAPPNSLHLDPEHPVFRRVASGGHADFLAVERGVNEKTGKPRSEIVVDDVRSIGGIMSLTPAEGGWRAVVVDTADEMNRHAANALLKVLEEPPARALVILVSHSPGRLLPTIVSRCRRLPLQALADDDVAALLAAYRADLPAEDRADLVGLAEGSIGRALALADEGGVGLYRDLAALLVTLGQLDIGALHALGDRVGRAGAEEAFLTVTDFLRWWLGRLILFAARGQVPPSASSDDRALMERLAPAAALDRWLEVWEKINRLLARAGGANLDRKQVFLNAFFALERAARH
jgi:DNA polymerase-3 subunit delta'